MSDSKKISEIFLERASLRRPKIGISILNESESILESLKKAESLADVVVYSQHQIQGFEAMVFEKETEIGPQMVRDFKNGKIDQFVRGQIDDFRLVDEFKIQFSVSPEEKRRGIGLLEDVYGRQFFLAMGSNPEGQTLEEKIAIIDDTVKWLKNNLNIDSRVAVMATCRPGSVGRDPNMTKSFEDAEQIVKHLKNQGADARNIHIELQSALPWANVLLPANGAIGNQIFRALVLLGGGKMYNATIYFQNGATYEDNSRNEEDYFNHIISAAAIANKNMSE